MVKKHGGFGGKFQVFSFDWNPPNQNFDNEKRKIFIFNKNMFYPFITKLDYYKFENELRCIITAYDEDISASKLVDVDLKVQI